MASFGETFDVSSLPVSENNFDPLPAGWYTATIGGAELKDTKTGTGQYIAVRYNITGPTHQGRVVFGNINIRNANPQAESIGRQQLGEILRAIGLARANDTDQLVGHDLSIKLSIQKSDQYGDKNEVKGFKAIEGGSPAPRSMPSAPAATAAPAKAAPPWAKK